MEDEQFQVEKSKTEQQSQDSTTGQGADQRLWNQGKRRGIPWTAKELEILKYQYSINNGVVVRTTNFIAQ